MKCMPIILINMCKNTSSPHAGIKPPTLRMTMASPISRLRILQGSTLESQELKMRYCMGTLRAHSMSFVLHILKNEDIIRTSNIVYSNSYNHLPWVYGIRQSLHSVLSRAYQAIMKEIISCMIRAS